MTAMRAIILPSAGQAAYPDELHTCTSDNC